MATMKKNENSSTESPPLNPVADDDNTIATELVRARKTLGWTQVELHQKSGISRESIKQYETGRNKPGGREIRLLCEALGISPNRLLFGRDDFESNPSALESILNTPDDAKQRYFLMMAFGMLTSAEKSAVITLIEPILISRQGGKTQLRDLFAKFDNYGFMLTNQNPPTLTEEQQAKRDALKREMEAHGYTGSNRK